MSDESDKTMIDLNDLLPTLDDIEEKVSDMSVLSNVELLRSKIEDIIRRM